MIANTAFLAALTLFLFVAWLAGEVEFLAPYRGAIFREHGLRIALAALIVFLNLFAMYYTAARWLFLRETGRKLSHVDHQLTSSDAVVDELRSRLTT